MTAVVGRGLSPARTARIFMQSWCASASYRASLAMMTCGSDCPSRAGALARRQKRRPRKRFRKHAARGLRRYRAQRPCQAVPARGHRMTRHEYAILLGAAMLIGVLFAGSLVLFARRKSA